MSILDSFITVPTTTDLSQLIGHSSTSTTLSSTSTSSSSASTILTPRQFLLLFPSHAYTVIRVVHQQQQVSEHCRQFHAQRLAHSFTACQACLPLSGSMNQIVDRDVSVKLMRTRLDELIDTAIRQYKNMGHNKTALEQPQQQVITIVCVQIPSTTSSSSSWCLVGYSHSATALLADSPPPSITVSTGGSARLLASAKHSQWVRDRVPLEHMKQNHGVYEVILHEGDTLLEGLTTNLFVRDKVSQQWITPMLASPSLSTDHSHSKDHTALSTQLLSGYYRHLILTHPDAHEGRVSIKALRAGLYDAMFICGTGIGIIPIKQVKLYSDCMTNNANTLESSSCTQITESDSALSHSDAAAAAGPMLSVLLGDEGQSAALHLRQWLLARLIES